MKVIRSADEMRRWVRARRCEGLSLGLVPTMGALHEGHASLIRESVRRDDETVVSVFVNPAQFAPGEDFDQYPRTFEADAALCEGLGAGAIYAPVASEMYPEGYATYVEVERLSEGLCGRSRPTFFRGVCTVVTKLFHAVEPDRAYFGQKDAQQAAVIGRMERDLDFGIEIVVLPIVREPDGLAMSSRNAYLSPEERPLALGLSRGLGIARELLEGGEREPGVIVQAVREAMDGVKIDYVELVDADEMVPLEAVRGRVLIAVAGWVGKTRLIDNAVFEAPEESGEA